MPGYNVVHSCRDDGYGGTSIYIRKNLQYSVEICESKNFIDTVILTLRNQCFSGKNLKIMSFYRSQKCNLSTFFTFLEDILNNYGGMPCVFVGDSNINVLRSPLTEELFNLLQSYNYVNCHNLVTRPARSSSIDNVFSNIHNQINIDSIECNITDHNLIYVHIDSEIKNDRYVETVYSGCNYERVREKIKLDLEFNVLSGNPSEDLEQVISCVLNAVNSSTVVTTKKKLAKYDLTPWINGNLQSLIEYKQKLLLKRRKTRNKPIELNLKRISKVIKLASEELYNAYYDDNISKFLGQPRKC